MKNIFKLADPAFPELRCLKFLCKYTAYWPRYAS